MYYPYLRTKQAELLALRERFELVCKNITPILEPVNELSGSTLKKTISLFKDNEQKVRFIINPNVGAYRDDIIKCSDTRRHFGENLSFFVPTIVADNASLEDIRAITTDYQDSSVSLIFRKTLSPHLTEILEEIPSVREIITRGRFRDAIKRKAPDNSDIHLVLLEDYFDKERRNADYPTGKDIAYTEDCFYFKEQGYSGYGDFQTIGEEYIDGGFMPRAVALHWTYCRDNGIYIQHFLSDNRESVGDVKEKFSEALTHLVDFLTKIDESDLTLTAKQVLGYANKPDWYPGLGFAKRLSIMNHLEIVSDSVGC